MGNSIYDSDVIFKLFLEFGLTKFYRRIVLGHIMSIMIAVFCVGYKGKISQVSDVSPRHRTTVAHFLNHGDWEEEVLARLLKEAVIRIIYKMAVLTGKPIICIADDTISSKTKPSSRALHPIEDAYFHQSHLKKKQDYGHQAVAVLAMALHFLMTSYCTTRRSQKFKSSVKLQMNCLLPLFYHILSVIVGTPV